MKFFVAVVAFSIVSFARNVESLAFIRDILFPRLPEINRVRNLEDPRALNDDDAVLDTVGLVEQHGYPAEQHNVTTGDGYNILFFRIPGSPLSPRKKGKLVVFLQHGLMASSDVWVFLGPDYSLAYSLADAGYDVWLGNIRGNSYGRSHTNLSVLDKDFWDFSYHELSTLDLPAIIDYVLDESEQKNLFYIGHSMGTTMSYILLSERPEYNDRMRLVISLAPVAFWTAKLNHFYQFLVDNRDFIKELLDWAEIYDIAPQSIIGIRIGRVHCSDSSTMQPLCISVLSVLSGSNVQELNTTMLPHILRYFPAGASVKSIIHYLKNIASGVLEKFDYGETGNVKVYGQKEVPIYDLNKISAPFALLYGKGDALALEENVAELAKRLRNVVINEAVSFGGFNHLNFIWAKHAKRLTNDRIIEILSIYSK